jgi:hypothetical protein
MENNMPLIAIPFGLILLFLIGTGFVKCGRWLTNLMNDEVCEK